MLKSDLLSKLSALESLPNLYETQQDLLEEAIMAANESNDDDYESLGDLFETVVDNINCAYLDAAAVNCAYLDAAAALVERSL